MNKERAAMAGIAPASEEAARALAQRLHAAMTDSNHSHWFKLFKHMDQVRPLGTRPAA